MATLDHEPAPTGPATASPADQYEALRNVATAVANGAEPAAVFRLVAEGAAHLVGADGCGVIRFEVGNTGRLVGRWLRPEMPPRDVPMTMRLDGPSAAATVFRTGRPARVDDYEKLDDDRARILSTLYRSGVAVPVRIGTTLWGAVAVGSAAVGVLPPDTAERLADFAELVALAVASPDPESREGIESLLDTLLSSAPVGLAFLDRNLRFMRINQALADFTGRRPPEEYIGLTPWQIVPTPPPVVVEALTRVCETGVPALDREIVVGSPDTPRGQRHLLASFYPVISQDEQSLGVGVVVSEVTDAKRAADELRHERDYSAALIEAMQDGLAVASPDGSLIDVNLRFCEMTGFDRAELVGSSPPYPYWPQGDELAAIEAVFRRALQGHTGEHDLVFRRKDGQALPVVVAHAPFRDAADELRGFVATVRDVTERRRAEEERGQLLAAERAARDRTELLQTITASLATALTPEQVLDVAARHGFDAIGASHGTVMLVDGEALVTARSVDLQTDGVGLPLRISLDDPSPLAEVARTGRALFFETRDGLRRTHPGALERVRVDTQSAAVVPLLIEDRILGVLGFAFKSPRRFSLADRGLFVTLGGLCAQALERAELYAQARAYAETLSERDALRTAVLRGVSHEFRSPLTAIANAAGALEHVVEARERRELLSVVGAETHRLDRLVSNVLDLSRLEGGALEPRFDWCSPAELVAGALEAAAALAGGTRIDVDIADDLPLIRADPVLTERILLNLLHNAVRHGSEPIRLEVRAGADALTFTVADEGRGVPVSAVESIFEPFVGARDRGGLGLGLGLSRGLAEAQGGRLRLDPSTSGARFVLSLPIDHWEEW
jgi:PAS domain S-box-containing protein